MTITVYLQRSPLKGKKYKVTVIKKSPQSTQTVHFGATGYSDYTKHKDYDRMLRYLSRHEKREDWTLKGIATAGFWSRWLLWNKPSIQDSVADMEKRFKIKIVRGSPPKGKQ